MSTELTPESQVDLVARREDSHGLGMEVAGRGQQSTRLEHLVSTRQSAAVAGNQLEHQLAARLVGGRILWPQHQQVVRARMSQSPIEIPKDFVSQSNGGRLLAFPLAVVAAPEAQLGRAWVGHHDLKSLTLEVRAGLTLACCRCRCRCLIIDEEAAGGRDSYGRQFGCFQAGGERLRSGEF